MCYVLVEFFKNCIKQKIKFGWIHHYKNLTYVSIFHCCETNVKTFCRQVFAWKEDVVKSNRLKSKHQQNLESQIQCVINVALLCVHIIPPRCPSMMHVLAMLLEEKEVEVAFQESLGSKQNIHLCPN